MVNAGLTGHQGLGETLEERRSIFSYQRAGSDFSYIKPFTPGRVHLLSRKNPIQARSFLNKARISHLSPTALDFLLDTLRTNVLAKGPASGRVPSW